MQSNNVNFTIVSVTPTVSLSINKTNFNLGDAYNLAMSTSPSIGSGRPIQLCSTFTPGSGSTGTAHTNRCTGFDYTSNASGGFNWTGTFDSTDFIGTNFTIR
ncbi:MAG: hypothetical protein HYT65_00480 [Candidatus Yanofskybacteria bacterium]|nr:hypothetical protein [Candidatus Yanofskybacteria bacterium]